MSEISNSPITGGSFTITVKVSLVTSPVRYESLTVSVTLYVPGLSNECHGMGSCEIGVASPKSQEYSTIPFQSVLFDSRGTNLPSNTLSPSLVPIESKYKIWPGVVTTFSSSSKV